MTNELLNINIQKIHVQTGIIEFKEYESLKQQALELATNIEQVEVNDENIQVSKKLLAAVNKRVKEMEDKRISIKKEILAPYDAFEQQVKEIVSIVKDADTIVRNQIRTLEEKERDEKKEMIEEIFEKRIKQYELGGTFGFEDFIKPQHLNKSTSLKAVETLMVDWLERIDTDVKVINTLPNGEEILTEYYDTKDLSVAIRIVNERAERKKQISHLVKPTENTGPEKFNITVYDEKDLTTLEMFMQLKKIKYSVEKVEM